LIKTTEAPHYRRFIIQHRREIETSEPSGPVSRSGHYSHLGLNDGKGIMFVGHTGLIHPSGFMPIVCGIFPLASVVEVYQKSTIFRSLRNADQFEGRCGYCEFRHLCGGSRARAYAVTGNPLAQEPDCTYVPRRASRQA
jgi:MoaA/NifB/PqqE/SkfB family radical SAM enzyme